MISYLLKTRELTIGALGCALSVLFLYLSSIVPTGKLALAFIASIVPCVVLIESHSKLASLLSGIAGGIVAAFFLPKSGLSGVITVAYCAVLCYYPAVKSYIESLRNIFVEWAAKLVLFAAASVIIKIIVKALGIPLFPIFIPFAALVLYDILLTFMISYYMKEISPRIRKR